MDVTEGEAEELAEPEPDKEGVTDGLMLTLTDAVMLFVASTLGDDDPLLLALSVEDRDRDGLIELVMLMVPDSLADLLPLNDAEPLELAVSLMDGDPDRDPDADDEDVALALPDADVETLAEELTEEVPADDADVEGLSLPVAVAEELTLPDPDWLLD